MFVICAVFALISSCKNYASSKDLKGLAENAKQQVKGFLDTKKEELTEGPKSLESEVYSKVEELMQADELQGQLQQQVAQGVDEDSEASKLKEEIEKKNKELKDAIEKSDAKKTPIETYLEYEKTVKEIREKLKDKLKDKKEDKENLEKELETLEKNLKEKIEKRKKELEAAQKEFQRFREQVNGATGQTQGDQAKNQGKVGLEAWNKAKALGLNGNYSANDGTGSNEFAKKVVDDVIKKIEEELQNTGEKFQNSEKKK